MRDVFINVRILGGAILLAGAVAASSASVRNPDLRVSNTPVGLILSAPDARIAHESRPEIHASPGDLLFVGDRVRTLDSPAVLVLCPAGKKPTRQSLAAASGLTIERDRVAGTSRNLKQLEELPFCRLPEVTAEPDIGSKGAEGLSLRVADPAAYPQRVAGLPEPTRRELNALDATLQTNPQDMLAMTSRAALLDSSGLAAEAADQYATIAGAWKDQQWAKMLVQVDRRKAMPARGAGTTYAVVIGISNYDNKEIHDLQFAHKDAQRFAEYLSKARGHNVPAANIKLLINGEATLPAIQENIRYLTEKAGKDDTVVFFISGHGEVSGGQGYLIPNHANPQNLPDSAYPMASLSTLMAELSTRVGRFAMFVDACRAGMIGHIGEKNAINARIQAAVQDADNVTALLASGQKEVAFEHSNFGLGEGHSAFTYFLLRGIAADGVREADFDGDGKVSLGELSQFVQEKVIEATDRHQHPLDVSGKNQDVEQVEVANLADPGIKLSGWKPMPKALFSNGKALAVEAPPISEVEGPLPRPDEADLQRLIRLEEQGQEIMLRYLEGDEIPQAPDDFRNARDWYTEALDLARGSLLLESRKEFFQGRLLIFDKQYDAAIAHLETAIRLNPRSPASYNALGIAYLEIGKYAEAIAAFESAIARAWYWPYPRHNLALTYMQLGRYELAIAAYRKAMELAPEYSYLPYNLGLIFHKMNRRRDAEDAYLHAKRLADLRASQSTSPHLAEAYAERRAIPLIALAQLEADDGRTAQATRDFQASLDALAPYPGNRNVLIARHDMAVLLAKNPKTWDEAESLLARNLDAGYLPSRQRMAEWLAERRKPAEAVPHFEALLVAKPEYTAARLKLAEQLDQLGDNLGERMQLELARRNAPNNPLVLLALARFETVQKRWNAAREAYQAALENTLDAKQRKQIAGTLRRLK
jgi:tetratricopeptide (TPR) repeat protein